MLAQQLKGRLESSPLPLEEDVQLKCDSYDTVSDEEKQ